MERQSHFGWRTDASIFDVESQWLPVWRLESKVGRRGTSQELVVNLD